MTDIILDKEDFKVVNPNANEYDLYVSNDQEMYNLILRAVETPFEYIGRYVLDKEGLKGIDYTFGNAVYEDLSEGLTIGLISSIKTHIREAIAKVTLDIDIDEIIVSIPNFDTVEIQIYIDGLEKPIRTQVNI